MELAFPSVAPSYARREMGSAGRARARTLVSSGLTTLGRGRAAVLVLAGAALVLLPAATASHTPNPSSVTVAGSLQSELGCPGDWQPDCAATHLTYDAGDDVWQRTFSLPAGSYEYKAALNDSWTENYGLHAQPNGANVPLSLPSDASVKFYYDHKSHWVTDNRGSVIAVAPGSFQSELGCPGDWDPGCLRSWLQDPDGNGIYSFETTALPPGSYEAKVAINESWDENYGQGGVPGGSNIAFTVPVDNAKVTFTYDATSHVLTIVVREPSGSAGRARRAVALRPRPQGLPRHRPQHDLEGLVHGRERRPQRRLLPDDRQHERRDAPVRRHRRRHLHRPADARHDLRPSSAIHDSGGMACKVTATAKRGTYRIATEVHHRSRPEHGAHARQLQAEARRLPAVRALRPDGERQRRRRPGERRRRPGDDRRLDRPSRPRRLRSGHRDERGEPRLRAAGLRRPRRPVHRGIERLRRRGERRARPARRRARADEDLRRRARRQRRPDRAGRAESATARPSSRSASAPPRTRPSTTAEGSLDAGFHETLADYAQGWKQLRQRADEAADGEAAGDQGRGPEAARGRVLPQRQRDQGVRGQDVPRRDRRQPRLAVGPGGLGRRPGEHVLRLLPRGVRARSVRVVDRPRRRRRPRDGARRDPVPLRAPAAAGRLDAAQQPRQRQGRARLVRDAARRDRLPDPDGVPARAHRCRRCTRITSSRPRTSSPRADRRSASSAGRSRAASRRRRSRPRSPVSSPRPSSRARTATRRRRRSGSASRTPGSGR